MGRSPRSGEARQQERGTAGYKGFRTPAAATLIGCPVNPSTKPQSNSQWWKSAVIYEISPISFQDANGDGKGDLNGIEIRIDYLQWLGVDAVWLTPFFVSPMLDFGYDISDYCEVDPRFCTLHDFDHLVEALHTKDIRLLLDFVPNHTSDQHPWFADSRSSRN